MARLIAMRLAMSGVSLFLAAAFAFGLIHLSPTDPAALALGEGATDAQKLELSRQLGLDRPLVEQFFSWALRAIRGDFGESIFLHVQVRVALFDAAPVTLSLTGGAVFLAVVVGLTLGFAAGMRPGSWIDRMISSSVSLALAIPSFWLALLLALLFSVKLRILPVAGYIPFTENPLKWLYSLALPCLALSVHGAAVIGRHMRGAVIDALEAPFIEAARARGAPKLLIMRRYVLKNALGSALPIIGIEVAVLLATSVVMEKVFVLPGVGTLLVNAVIASDFPMLQGAILLIATILVLTNLIIDLGLGLLDPRVRPQ